MTLKTLTFALLSATLWGQLEVVTTGLQTPQKIIVASPGTLLVSETSLQPNAGRVSIVTSAGARRTLIEGLPSGTEVNGGSSGPTAMAVRERLLYIALGGGDTERRGERPGTSIHNPLGPSSPLFSSILRVRLNQDIDRVSGPFRLTVPQQQALGDGGEVQLEDGGGGTAVVDVLVRLPISEPDANTINRFSNLWGLALTEEGSTLFVVDASFNALVRVDTATGRWQRLMRFAPAVNPGTVGPPRIDAVPTSLRIYGDEVLVSFLSGVPFLPGAARVIAVNPAQRTSQPFILGLTSAVDVLWRPMGAGRPQFFALEFSQNQSAQPAAPGRLLRFDTEAASVVASDLRAPASLAYDASTRALYVVELTGRLLRLQLE